MQTPLHKGGELKRCGPRQRLNAKRLGEFKKDADTHLKQEMAVYCVEKWASFPTHVASTVVDLLSSGIPTGEPTVAPSTGESTVAPPLAAPPMVAPPTSPPMLEDNTTLMNELRSLLRQISSHMDHLEHSIMTQTAQPDPPGLVSNTASHQQTRIIPTLTSS
jgi:hypothetical protein